MVPKKGGLVRKENPFRSIHILSSSSKFIDEALSLPPVVSAFAPLAAASAPRPDNSPSNPRGGKGAAERERRRERSAHPRPGAGVRAEIFPPGVSRRFVKAAKVDRPRVRRGMKGGEGGRSMVKGRGGVDSRRQARVWHVSAYYSFRIGR